MSEDEQIWHVDENDMPIGSISRSESRRLGARYRMVRIMIESKDGKEILLQKRLDSKKSFPGCWDTSAGGNVDYGESYDTAAKRELLEEVGLENVSLRPAIKFYAEATDQNGDRLNRFTQLYIVRVDRDTIFTPQATEVERVEWISKDDLAAYIKASSITDGLKQVYERHYQDI